ncbi:MAG: endolytic transglycosylase MltG [Pseudomonadota bacterium]
MFSFSFTIALVAAIGFVGLVLHGDRQFDAPGPLTEPTRIEVPRGASFNSIIPLLEQKNAIPQQTVLRVFLRGVRASGKASQLKAGEFILQPGMSMREVMLELTDGTPIEHRITFPEGWTSLRIVERLAADETLVGDVPPIPPEGSLLPNTYAFAKGTTRTQALDLLKRQRDDAVQRVWESRAPDLPLKSPEELVILASIIEKETSKEAERAKVASVFINRLRRGMRLQTDPTVIYGIWGGRGKPKDRGGLRRSELDRATPYNTYKIDGLPPTPIANPGIASLRAAANPADTEFLFFVADGTGGHGFSKTLREHNRKVAEWRRIERQRKAERENVTPKPAPDDDNSVLRLRPSTEEDLPSNSGTGSGN